MHELVLKDVTVQDHGKTIVDHVSFEAAGSLMVIGESGAGKTTLLKALAGLKESQGNILLDGKDISSLPPQERHMAMIFQKAALFPHVRVKDNIGYGLKALGYSREEINEKVKETASLLHIEDLLERYPATLSGGEAQRVDMARALVRKPDVLLMDEPFSSLDERLSQQLEKEIEGLCERFDIMRVMVSHEMEEAMRFDGKMIYLSGGRIEEEGTAEKFMNAPEKLETARFFGQPAMQEVMCEVRKQEACVLGQHMHVNLKDGAYTCAFRPYWVEEGQDICRDVLQVRPYLNAFEVRIKGNIILWMKDAAEGKVSFHLGKVLFYDTDGRLCLIWTG